MPTPVHVRFRSLAARAFTLIELLMVIAIIGLLAAIIMVSLGDARNRGNDAAVKSSLAQARTQAELFYNANGDRYSISINDTTTNICNSAALVSGVKGVYSMLQDSADAAGVSEANIQTCAVTGGGGTCAGADSKITCHACPAGISSGNCGGQNSNAWAIEVPLKDNLGPSGADFWCIDSSGFNARNQDGSRLASGDTRCI